MKPQDLIIGSHVYAQITIWCESKGVYLDTSKKEIVIVKVIEECGINYADMSLRYDGVFEKTQNDECLLSGIPLTKDFLGRIKEAESVKNIIIPTWIIDLGRFRRLSITIEQGNQYVSIQSYDENDFRLTTDITIVFNGDYDGLLYAHKLQAIFHVFTGDELTISPPSK